MFSFSVMSLGFVSVLFLVVNELHYDFCERFKLSFGSRFGVVSVTYDLEP